MSAAEVSNVRAAFSESYQRLLDKEPTASALTVDGLHRTEGRELYELFRMRAPHAHLTNFIKTTAMTAIWRRHREAYEDADPGRRAYWGAMVELMDDYLTRPDTTTPPTFFDVLEYLVSPTPPPQRPPPPGPRPMLVWDKQLRLLRSWSVWVDDALGAADALAALRDVRDAVDCDARQTPRIAYEHQLLLLDRTLAGRLTPMQFCNEVRKAPWDTQGLYDDT